MTPPISIRAYARHRAEAGLSGKTQRSVQKAIDSGRIRTGPDGMIDAAAADLEWAATTGRRDRSAAARVASEATRRAAEAARIEEAKRLEDLARTTAEIDGMPDRLAASIREALPHLPPEDLKALDQLTREALERMADLGGLEVILDPDPDLDGPGGGP